jgi:hypothetical protein
MKKLTRADLYSLEDYAARRAEFRARVMAHKQNRRVSLSAHTTLYFEDRLTMHYQVQEMLRAERIFEAAGIEDELGAYNPLIPDGSNWKATFMIEFDDVEERKAALARMIGIEDRVWVQVDGFQRVFAIADEDLKRENEEKTSAVHFLRFDLALDMVRALKQGTQLAMGIDHKSKVLSLRPVPEEIRAALVADLDDPA